MHLPLQYNIKTTKELNANCLKCTLTLLFILIQTVEDLIHFIEKQFLGH